MAHPTYLGFQVDWPVFVKRPFKAGKKRYERGEHFNWPEVGAEERDVAALFANGFIYHNPDLEAEHKVGYRLHELTTGQLRSLVSLLNDRVKSRTESKEQYNKIRVRVSRIPEKQRTMIRRFLHNNPSFEEDYYEIFEYAVSKPKLETEAD